MQYTIQTLFPDSIEFQSKDRDPLHKSSLSRFPFVEIDVLNDTTGILPCGAAGNQFVAQDTLRAKVKSHNC